MKAPTKKKTKKCRRALFHTCPCPFGFDLSRGRDDLFENKPITKLLTLYSAYSKELKDEHDNPLGCKGFFSAEDDLDKGDATEHASPFDLEPGRGTGESVLLMEAIRTNQVILNTLAAISRRSRTSGTLEWLRKLIRLSLQSFFFQLCQ